jgi:hypothetical protein
MTDLSCAVCRAVHRFADLSTMVHFIVNCWFQSWPGHKTVMIQVFNGFPHCLHSDIRIVVQLGWCNWFLPCLFHFITKYLSHHLTPSTYNHKPYTLHWKLLFLLLYNSSSICATIGSYPAYLFMTWSATVIVSFVCSAGEPASIPEGLHSKLWVVSKGKNFVVFQTGQWTVALPWKSM